MHVAVFLGGLFALLQNANACSFPTAHQCNWAAYAIDKNPASAANLNSNNMANYGGTPYGQIVGVLPDSCFAKLPFAYAAQAEKCRKSTVDNLNTGVNIHQILKDNLTQKGYCGNVNIRTESWGDNQDPSSVVSYAGNSGNAFDGSMQLTACPVTVVPPSIRILINPSRTPFIANEIIMSGLTGQQYTVDVEISNAPTTAPITFNMPLPAGVTMPQVVDLLNGLETAWGKCEWVDLTDDAHGPALEVAMRLGLPLSRSEPAKITGFPHLQPKAPSHERNNPSNGQRHPSPVDGRCPASQFGPPRRAHGHGRYGGGAVE